MKTNQTESIETKLVGSENGFADYDVKGLPFVHRCTVSHSIKPGDIFNIYMGESSKLGVRWKGDLQKSLQEFSKSTHYLTYKARVSKRLESL